MKILFGVLGLILGAGIDNDSGALFGAAIGLLTGTLIQYRDQLTQLEKSLESLRARFELLSPATNSTEIKSEQLHNDLSPEESEVEVVTVATDELKTNDSTSQVESPDILPDPNFKPANINGSQAARETTTQFENSIAESAPGFFENVFSFIKDFFTKGNIVVKVAVIILFFGISFLIKYASENNLLPIELRLVGIALFAIGLLIIGWRLRSKNSLYALVLQGGAIGILYLTVFSAGRLDLIPMGFTFLILFLLVVFSCWMAVQQNAKSLALFATMGGFLAPILTSTGEGSHVSLFSYYAVLNVGIFVIAWFKSWRSLNWLGFVFTFVIASFWGMNYYQPKYFSSTEPFLILFFLFYVVISILFAFRQPPKLKGLVDGSLIFGTPLVGFALQSQLVKDFEYGHAWSAFAIGLLYLALNRFLKSRQMSGMKNLSDSFLALGVVFLTLAIPFTVDGHWTSAAWALEGAGILWIGLRQQQWLPKAFGLVLQFLAALIFIIKNESIVPHMPIANSLYLGSVMISLAGLFSSYQYSLRENTLSNLESVLPKVLFYWGVVWWFGINLYEIDHHLASQYEINAALIFIALSFLAMALLGQLLDWKFPEQNTVIFLPILTACTFVAFLVVTKHSPFANYGFIAWPLAFAIQYCLLYRNRDRWDKHLLLIYHAITMWLVIFIVTWLVVDVVEQYLSGLAKWSYLLWGLVPVMCLCFLFQYKESERWPFKQYQSSYFSGGLLPVMAFLALWFIQVCGENVDPAPLAYLPILNPQDIIQLFVLGFMVYWIRMWLNQKLPKPDLINKKVAFSVVGLLTFVWLNSLVAHAVHNYANVDFNLYSMFRSELFQASISIVWTLTAFLVMFLSAKKNMRQLWFVGASLLGLVVLKLFIVDMQGSGTLTRIISFISVAVLMLIISYFSPMPTKVEENC